MTSEFSLLTAIVFFNLAMVFIAILRRMSGYLTKCSAIALILLAFFSALRVILPLDFSFAYVVHSYVIIPTIESALKKDIWPGAGQFSLGEALIIIWGIGSVVMLIRTVFRYHKDWVCRKRYKIFENAQVNCVVRRLRLNRTKVLVSPDIGIPYVAGIFHAHIYLPDIAVPDDTLEMIIKHEYQHYKSRDILIKSFYLLLCIVFWWNPIVHAFQRELDRLLEIRCDSAMTKQMDENEKLEYLQSLLSVMKHIRPGHAAPLINPLSLVQAGQSRFVDQRAYIVLKSGNVKSAFMQILSISLVILLFIASFTVIVQPAYSPSGEDNVDVFRINQENAHILVTRNNTYELYVDGLFLVELSEAALEAESYKGIPIISDED